MAIFKMLLFNEDHFDTQILCIIAVSLLKFADFLSLGVHTLRVLSHLPTLYSLQSCVRT